MTTHDRGQARRVVIKGHGPIQPQGLTVSWSKKKKKKTVTPGPKVTRRRIFQCTTASFMHGLKISQGHTRLLEDAEMLVPANNFNVIHFIGNFFVGVGVWGDELPLR